MVTAVNNVLKKRFPQALTLLQLDARHSYGEQDYDCHTAGDACQDSELSALY